MKTLLVIASGRCAWDDLYKAIPILKKGGFDSIAVNYMVICYPFRLTYAASWHYDILPTIVKVRTFKGKKNRPITFGPKPYEGIDKVQRFTGEPIPTSGMYAARIGVELGYDKIVLAGLPFDDSGHFYDPPSNYRKPSRFVYEWPSKNYWEKFRDKNENKITAVSGNLVECFGELTREWIETPIQEL